MLLGLGSSTWSSQLGGRGHPELAGGVHAEPASERLVARRAHHHQLPSLEGVRADRAVHGASLTFPWHGDHHLRALADLALDLDPAAVPGNHRMAGEADPGALALGREEQIEDPRELRRRDPGAVVGDRDRRTGGAVRAR